MERNEICRPKEALLTPARALPFLTNSIHCSASAPSDWLTSHQPMTSLESLSLWHLRELI